MVHVDTTSVAKTQSVIQATHDELTGMLYTRTATITSWRKRIARLVVFLEINGAKEWPGDR
jgi:hypothetical protein